MNEERNELNSPSGSDEWWMSGWTRLYDKLKNTDGFYANGTLMCKQSYAFLRMAQIVSRQNTETTQSDE